MFSVHAPPRATDGRRRHLHTHAPRAADSATGVDWSITGYMEVTSYDSWPPAPQCVHEVALLTV